MSRRRAMTLKYRFLVAAMALICAVSLAGAQKQTRSAKSGVGSGSMASMAPSPSVVAFKKNVAEAAKAGPPGSKEFAEALRRLNDGRDPLEGPIGSDPRDFAAVGLIA